MNLWKTLLLSAAVLTVGGGMISCSDSDDDKRFEGKPTINVTPTSAAVELTGGTVDVAVTSDAPWTVKADADDVTFSRKSGNGNANVTVTVPAAAERTITVTFTATGYISGVAFPQRATVTIAQNEGGESLDGTIASITAVGTYDIKDAWVVANTTQSFLMTDRSKAYMYVYVSSEGTVPAVGKVIDVNGTVELRNKYFQFSKPTVTVKENTHEVTLPAPQVLDYAGFFGIPEGEFAYVKVTGTLVQSGNYTNVTFSEGSNIGSVLYPNADLNVANFYNKICDVTGFVTGMPNGINQLVVTELKENTDMVILNVNPEALSFDANGGTKDVQISAQNGDNLTLVAEVSGANASDFQAVTGDNKVTVTATANTGAARTATLTVSLKDGSTVKASKEVSLSQAEAGASTATLDFLAQNYTNQQEITSLTVAPITATFAAGTNSNVPKFYSSGNAIRMYGGNSVTVSGATITRIEFTMPDDKVYANTFDASAGELTPTKDDAGKWSAAVWTGSAESVTFTIGGTSGQHRISKMVVTYKE